MKLNNKGFTLVELLAVLVILIAISSIAIPTISSSLDRSKNKQTKAKEELIKNAAELYVTDHRNQIQDECYINAQTLIDRNYLDANSLNNENDEKISTCIHYIRNQNKYILETSCGSPLCIY